MANYPWFYLTGRPVKLLDLEHSGFIICRFSICIFTACASTHSDEARNYTWGLLRTVGHALQPTVRIRQQA